MEQIQNTNMNGVQFQGKRYGYATRPETMYTPQQVDDGEKKMKTALIALGVIGAAGLGIVAHKKGWFKKVGDKLAKEGSEKAAKEGAENAAKSTQKGVNAIQELSQENRAKFEEMIADGQISKLTEVSEHFSESEVKQLEKAGLLDSLKPPKLDSTLQMKFDDLFADNQIMNMTDVSNHFNKSEIEKLRKAGLLDKFAETVSEVNIDDIAKRLGLNDSKTKRLNHLLAAANISPDDLSRLDDKAILELVNSQRTNAKVAKKLNILISGLKK